MGIILQHYIFIFPYKNAKFYFLIILHITQHWLSSRHMCIRIKDNYHFHMKHQTKKNIKPQKAIY